MNCQNVAKHTEFNFANCYQNGPQKARKEAKERREGKESNHNRKEEGNYAEMLRPSDPEAGPSGLQTIPKERKDTREPENQLLTSGSCDRASLTYIHAVHSARVPSTHYRSQHIQANTTRGFIQSVS